MGGSGREAGQEGPQLPGLSPRHLGPCCSSPCRSGGQQLALPGQRTPLWVFWPPRLPRCAGCWVRLTQGPLKCSEGTKATGLPGPTTPGRPLAAQVQGALGSTVPRKLPALKKKTQPNTRPLHTLAWAPTPPRASGRGGEGACRCSRILPLPQPSPVKPYLICNIINFQIRPWLLCVLRSHPIISVE